MLHLADCSGTESHLDVGILIGADLYWSAVSGEHGKEMGPQPLRLSWVGCSQGQLQGSLASLP